MGILHRHKTHWRPARWQFWIWIAWLIILGLALIQHYLPDITRFLPANLR